MSKRRSTSAPLVSKAPPPPSYLSGGVSASIAPYSEVSKPDWKKWSNTLSAPLWQAVALSLDMDPGSVREATNHLSNGDPFRNSPQEFKERLKLAVNHLECDNLSTKKREANTADSEVDLRVFAAWATSLEWNLHDQFPRDRSPHVASSGAEARCRKWLAQQMRRDDPKTNKKCGYATMAKEKFGVEGRPFNRAWDSAVTESERPEFSRGGRKSGNKKGKSAT